MPDRDQLRTGKLNKDLERAADSQPRPKEDEPEGMVGQMGENRNLSGSTTWETLAEEKERQEGGAGEPPSGS